MIRIVALPQGSGAGRDLDCQEVKIEWNMSAVDMSKPSRRQAPYSLNFQLPFTPTNNRFFNHFYEVNIEENTWSHRVKTDVIVSEGLDEIFTGVLQLMAVNTFTETYECNIIGESANLFTSLRGKTWGELLTGGTGSTTILDHVVSMDNVVDSWNTSNDITAGAGAGTIVYTIADNAEFQNANDHTFIAHAGLVIGSSDSQTPTPIRAKHCRPTIRVKWLIDYLFASAGFTYESQFLGTPEFDRLYMTLATESESIPMRSLYACKVGIGGDIAMTEMTWANVAFVVETGDYYDPDGLVGGGSFIAPASGTYSLSVFLNWQCDTATSPSTLHTYCRAVVGTTPFVATAQTLVGTLSSASVVMQYNFNLVLSAGQVVSFQARHSTNLASPLPWYIEQAGTYMMLSTYDTNNGVINIPEAFPDLTADEWLRAIVAEFNLAVVSSTTIDKHMVIEPMQDYLDDYGEVKDWTHKVDLDKPITLRPTTDKQVKRITFEDASSRDSKNLWWENAFSWVKGRKRHDNDNEFAVGDESVGGVFAPFRLSHIPYGWEWNQETTMAPNFLILRLWSKRDGRVRSNSVPPMLAFYHGLKASGTSFYVEGGTLRTTYPFFSHLSSSPATDDSWNLRWGYDVPDYGTHPYVGMSGLYKYRTWYARPLESMYGADARFLQCEVHLTARDVRSLTFADKLFVKDAYYRLYELRGYVVGEDMPSRVTLLKDVSTTNYACTSYPIAWGINGQVIFADSETGEQVPATAQCCIAADYVWDDDAGVCLWNTDTGVHEDEGGSTNDGNPQVPQAPNGYEQESTDPTTGITGSEATFNLYGVTNDGTSVPLSSTFGQTDFYLPNNAVVMLELNFTAYQYDGTTGLVGSNSTINQQALIQANAGALRVVGSSVINTEGTSRTMSIALSDEGVPVMQIRADGIAGQDVYWFGSVHVVGMIIPEDYTPPVVVTYEVQYNGNGEFMEFNGGTGDYTLFNG